MRFISQARRMRVQIQAGRSEYLAGGVERPIIPNINVQFVDHDVTDDEIKYAAEAFSGINGRKLLRDEVTMEPLRNRMSGFDTDWPDNVREWEELDEQFGKEPGYHKRLVEEKLLSRSGPDTDILLVQEVRVPAPWPRYNDFAGTFEELAQRVVDDGYDLAQVLAYERQNLNRRELVELYETMLADQAQAEASGEYVRA